MTKEKREGGTGDGGHGLLEIGYEDKLMKLVQRNVEIGKPMKGCFVIPASY